MDVWILGLRTEGSAFRILSGSHGVLGQMLQRDDSLVIDTAVLLLGVLLGKYLAWRQCGRLLGLDTHFFKRILDPPLIENAVEMALRVLVK